MGMGDIKALFSFISGLGLFLYGMHLMASGLQKAFGQKTRMFVSYITENRLLGVFVGALITAIIQSSSATTVMIVGFVNAGLLSLTQAAGVIMGANIGTTITAWLVSINEWGSFFQPDIVASLCIGIGALLFYGKNQRKQVIGSILIGFGILFFGIEIMNAAIIPYRTYPFFVEGFALIAQNPILGIIIGILITALIQSSAASLGILQILAMNGLVSWNSGLFIILGQNIGTCISAMISSISANKNAKQAAMLHLLFNTFGALLFGAGFMIFFQLYPSMGKTNIDSVELAMIHTFFNLLTTVILYPFAPVLVKLTQKLIKEEETGSLQVHPLIGLDPRILQAPGIAIEQAQKETGNMADLVIQNVAACQKAFMDFNAHKIEEVYANEQQINQYEKELTRFLIHIESARLSDHQKQQQRYLLYVISDLERIGDRCKNIAELSEQMMKDGNTFSIGAYEDLEIIGKQSMQTVRFAIQYWKDQKQSIYFKETEKSEQMVDQMETQLRDKHIRRLSMRKCKVEAGVIFLDAISYLERISDYAMNIAQYTKEEANLSTEKGGA